MNSKNRAKKKNKKRLDRQLRSGKVEKTFKVVTETEVTKSEDENGEQVTVTETKPDRLVEVNTKKEDKKEDHKADPEQKRSQIREGKKNSKVTDIRAARAREKQKKRIRRIAAVGVIVVFALTVYLTRAYWVPKLEGILDRPKETVVNDGKTKSGNFPISFNEGSVSDITGIGNYLACLDKNQLRIYSEDGEQTNEFSHNYIDPELKGALKRMMIYDKGGSSLMVVNRKNKIYEKNVSGKILLGDIADNNNIAVVTEDAKYSGILYVYDPNGKQIYKWYSSARVLSVNFSADGEGCFLTTFSSKGGEMVSLVRYLRFDRDTEYMKSVELPVLALAAMDNVNGEYWVVGDTAFYRLDSEGQIIQSYDYSGELADYDLSRECAALCFKGLQRNSTELVMFRSDSDQAEPDTQLYTDDGRPVSLHIKDQKVLLLKDGVMECFDFSGNLLATAELDSDYTDFTFFGENIYFLDYREVNKISFTT